MAEEESSVPILVKLKVHYTFDAEHKIDHLTRPPQSYEVETVTLEDGTIIGAIEQRVCLDAVLASSPELTSNIDTDYAVYAYDYSETNTPLVGQGMLSKVLSQDPSTNEAMVTGKVTKSLLSKLSKNAQPFFEVKLRFTPMAIAGMQRARSGSMGSVSEGVQSQFSSFSHTGPGGIDRPQSPAEISRYQNFERMVHEGGPRRENSFSNTYGNNNNNTSRPSSRPGTPNHMQHIPPQPGSTHSRHNSHFNTFPLQHARSESFSGYYSGDEAQEEGPARKRARLTQVTQVKKGNFNIGQQPGSLRTAAMSASSLRIHQPTAVNPITALQRSISIEGAERPPTPKPMRQKTGRPRGRPRKNRDFERDDSSAGPSSPVTHHTLPADLPDSTMSSPEETREVVRQESIASSPPLPSSPPAISPNEELPEQTSVEPSSPVLPVRLPRPAFAGEHDSGFMSAQPEDAPKEDDLFGDFNTMTYNDFTHWLDDPLQTPGAEIEQTPNEIAAQNHYTPVFDDESTFEGPTPQSEQSHVPALIPQPPSKTQQIPVPVLQNEPEPNAEPRTQVQQRCQPQLQSNNSFPRPLLPPQTSFQQPVTTDRNGRPVPTLLPRPTQAPLFHRAQSALPQIAASDPCDRPFQRSNTWAPDMSDSIMSDAAGLDDGKRKNIRKRIGKEQTKARLENAIASGEVPPYCHNCGAIETPAWRRGYIKIFTCSMDDVPTSLNPGECCYKQVISKNTDGSVKEWKGWKVEKPNGTPDDGWEQINLCNPCGLWFHKSKTPRPPEKWQKKDPKEKRKRKRPPKPPRSRTNPPRAAAGNLQSDALEPPSEDSSPADTSMEDGADDNPDDNGDEVMITGERDASSEEPQLPPMPKSMSVSMTRRTVMFAANDMRKVKSSPLTRGTAAEPIDIDLTPRPIRRVLFPSPQGGQAKQATTALMERTNDTLLPSFVRRSPRINKIRDMCAEEYMSFVITADGPIRGDGKENLIPRVEVNNDDDDLFGDLESMPPPMTPTPKRRSERLLLRTPGRTPSRESWVEASGNTSRTPNSKTPKQSTMDFSGIFLDEATRDLDPQLMTPFTRIIHDATKTPRSKGKTPTGFTPKTCNRASIFDFPDLPSLNTSSPFSKPHENEPFSELPTERMFSDNEDMPATDRLMPSSPPVNHLNGWDNFHDFMNVDQFDAVDWDAFEKEDSASKSKTPKKDNGELLGAETPGREGLRRSPRRAVRD